MAQSRLLKSDISDGEIIDSYELISDGYLLFFNTPIISTNSGTKTVLISPLFSLNTYDNPVASGDRFRLIGSTGADGYYIIDEILTSTSFSVLENINNSTGGDGYFMYTSGAFNVGFDRQRYPAINVIHDNVQQAIEDLDIAISGVGSGSLTPQQHATLRQLIHLADGIGGPMEGFLTNAYREILPTSSAFPTSIIWYSSSAKISRYVEKTISYNLNKTPSVIQWKAYATDGYTILSTVTDTITYSGPFEVSRIRGIVDNLVSGNLVPETHKYIRQLIHLADGIGGPFEGFISGAYREILPSANIFPNSIIWYEDITKAKKIVEKTISYNANKTVSFVSWQVYDTDGSTVLATVTDTPVYSGIFEVDRTRTII